MLKRSFAAWPLAAWVLLAGADLRAATFEVSATTNLTGSNAFHWNPLGAWGLTTVTSQAVDGSESHDASPWEGAYFHDVLHAQAGAATYGSDTSAGGGHANPKLLGYAIEPMADAVAHISRDCTEWGSPAPDTCQPYEKMPRAEGIAFAAVQHRIVQRGSVAATPETQAFLDQLNTIPVVLDVRLSTLFSTSGYAGEDAFATAFFGVLETGVGTLLARTVCVGSLDAGSYPCWEAGRKSAELIDEFHMNLKPTTQDRAVTFAIASRAHAWAQTLNPSCGQCGDSTAYAQAVADPFLRIDPTWDYAKYFVVQQESQLQPGEWVEPTRLWLAPSVPEPATWALMLAGAAALGGWTRRRPLQG